MSLTTADLKQISAIIHEHTSGLATKADLKHFATKDDFKHFATKDDIQELRSDLNRMESRIVRMESRLITSIELLQRDTFARLDKLEQRAA